MIAVMVVYLLKTTVYQFPLPVNMSLHIDVYTNTYLQIKILHRKCLVCTQV